jgi:hypothetical protein
MWQKADDILGFDNYMKFAGGGVDSDTHGPDGKPSSVASGMGSVRLTDAGLLKLPTRAEQAGQPVQIPARQRQYDVRLYRPQGDDQLPRYIADLHGRLSDEILAKQEAVRAGALMAREISRCMHVIFWLVLFSICTFSAACWAVSNLYRAGLLWN